MLSNFCKGLSINTGNSIPDSSTSALRIAVAYNCCSPFDNFSLLIISPVLSNNSISIISSCKSIRTLCIKSALCINTSIPASIFCSNENLRFARNSNKKVVNSPISRSAIISFSLSDLSTLTFFVTSDNYFFSTLISLLSVPICSDNWRV